MSITAWRIVKAKFASRAFDGEGSRRFGGRWNSKGIAIVYAAGSQALAVLELLVHLEDQDLMRHYRLFPITFADSAVSAVDVALLPADWKRKGSGASTRLIGDHWVTSERSPVLRVPSVVVPGEFNYLLNIAHPHFKRINIGPPQPYRFDSRLRKH